MPINTYFNQVMSGGNRRLLIIEDNPEELAHYKRLLETIEHPFDHIENVPQLSDGYSILLNNPPSCCLLNYALMDGTTEELLVRFNPTNDTNLCPIVLIACQEKSNRAMNLLHNGAQDYIVKQQLDAPQLQRALKNAMKTWQMQTQIKHLALFDSLTGLSNRALFFDRLAQTFKDSQRYKRTFALLSLDLDRFKLINEQYGNEAGDEILKAVGDRLRASLRESDTAARLGGDEFAILLPDINETKANHVAFKLVLALSFSLNWREFHISTTPSIGLTVWPSSAYTPNDLMSEAELALFRAKSSGRAQYATFSRKLEKEARETELLASALPIALLNQKLQIAWQPIINIADQKVECVEALVRWNHQNQWISPLRIIDLVIERRLGDIFHRWLFEQTITQFLAWRATNKSLKLALNLPANLCHDDKIINSLLDAMRTHSISPQNILVEITETHLMQNPDESRKQMERLANIGVEIAIDDFGTGYSSMQYLASLPCHTLKIDQSFFLTLHQNQRNRQIIEAITALSHRLGLKVVAEGIETAELLQAANDFGCDFAQGFWLGAPVISQSPFNTFCDESKVQGKRLMGR